MKKLSNYKKKSKCDPLSEFQPNTIEFSNESPGNTLSEFQQGIIKFCKEYEHLKKIKKMSLEEFKRILAERFTFFLENHTRPITCIALTSDNKYAVTGLKIKL